MTLLGVILTTPPPEFPEDLAAAALDRHWGIAGKLTRLASERDVNFHVATGAGDFVLKLANPAEPAAETDLLVAILLHLSGTDLPVPQPVPTQAGGLIVTTPSGLLRLQTFLAGRPLHRSAHSADLGRSIGQMAGRLAKAMQDFRHPAARRRLVWDIANCPDLLPLLTTITDPRLRQLAEEALNRFGAEVLPHQVDLPRQIVHNDLNPHNLLVSETDDTRIAGIIDFGDMVETPRMFDLAIAAAYQVDPARPVDSIAELVAAYHAVNPLEPREIALLPRAVAARLATTLAITHERARLYPGNAAYILRNVPVSAEALEALAGVRDAVMIRAIEERLR